MPFVAYSKEGHEGAVAHVDERVLGSEGGSVLSQCPRAERGHPFRLMPGPAIGSAVTSHAPK